MSFTLGVHSVNLKETDGIEQKKHYIFIKTGKNQEFSFENKILL